MLVWLANVIYILFRKKYSSTISKYDADLQAVNDLKANGQLQANLYGNCMPSTCAFNSSNAVPYLSVGVSKVSPDTVQIMFDGIFIADDLVMKTLLLQGVIVKKSLVVVFLYYNKLVRSQVETGYGQFLLNLMEM